MTSLFASLSSPLQVQALDTMAGIWRCDPPRHDIDLELISAALLERERLLEEARRGCWEEGSIRELETLITAVGGNLAPDLRSHGPQSLQVWREASFGRLRGLLQPAAAAAALKAVGAALQRQQPRDLASCFALQRQLLAPLLDEEAPPPWIANLLALEPEHQVAVFEALAAACQTGADPADSGLLSTLLSALPQNSGLVTTERRAGVATFTSELELLDRYGVTADALRRGLVLNLVNSVSFPENTMAAVIAELMDDLNIPPPYPERIDQAWLDTLSEATRCALIESWEDLRLRHWIEANLNDQAEALFAQRASEFDRYIYECVQTSDAELAQNIHRLATLSVNNLGELATRYSEGEERWTKGVVGPVLASELHGSLRARLQRLQPGELSEPLPAEGTYQIVRLLHHFPARLDQALRQQLLWELFEQELETRVDAGLREIEAGEVDFPALLGSVTLLPPPPASDEG